MRTTISCLLLLRQESMVEQWKAKEKARFCVSGVYLLGMGSWVTEHLEARKKSNDTGQMQTEHV